MRNLVKKHPSLVFLVVSVIFFLAGDLTVPVFAGIVFIMGKLQKTELYGVVKGTFGIE